MDGGYYAIKGFEFQIDKTILEILRQTDNSESINIEQIQDLDSNNFVMQVKYKEAAKFYPSSIRGPVVQLIDEFLKDRSKQYILYCYFGDFNIYNHSIKVDTILGNGNSQFTKNEILDFSNSFKLIFADKFDIQLEKTIKEIVKLGYNEEEAIIYHARITKYLRNLVIDNNPSSSINVSNRSCTKQDLISLIKNDRRIIFSNSFRDYQGDELYFNKLKKKYFTFRNLDKQINFFVLELKEKEKVSDIKQVVLTIMNKYFKINTRDVKGEAPYIYFKNIKSKELVKLKESLVKDEVLISDGFDFEGSSFNLNSIVKKSNKENKIGLKFINRENELIQLIEYNFRTTSHLFQFYISEPIEFKSELNTVNIAVKEINEIIKIIK